MTTWDRVPYGPYCAQKRRSQYRTQVGTQAPKAPGLSCAAFNNQGPWVASLHPQHALLLRAPAPHRPARVHWPLARSLPPSPMPQAWPTGVCSCGTKRPLVAWSSTCGRGGGGAAGSDYAAAPQACTALPRQMSRGPDPPRPLPPPAGHPPTQRQQAGTCCPSTPLPCKGCAAPAPGGGSPPPGAGPAACCPPAAPPRPAPTAGCALRRRQRRWRRRRQQQQHTLGRKRGRVRAPWDAGVAASKQDGRRTPLVVSLPKCPPSTCGCGRLYLSATANNNDNKPRNRGRARTCCVDVRHQPLQHRHARLDLGPLHELAVAQACAAHKRSTAWTSAVHA